MSVHPWIELLEDLRRPAAYPWRPATVELIETHISWVFLAGDYVIKIKRPVAFDFVDHTTLAARYRSCQEEVRLNRRLTTDVYRGVVPIVHDGTSYRVNRSGTPVEWATLMRRLPADRMLDALIEAQDIQSNLAARLAGRLIPFHRDVATPCGATPAGSATCQAAVLTDNLDELHRFAGSLVASRQLALIDLSMRSFLDENRVLLEQRVAEGWIRNGHGDLRAEHICLENDGNVQIFDCIEFNEALRCADVASDVAFLLMDLSRLGAGPTASALAARYRAADIDLPPALLNLYRAHRALVRAKVECLSLTGPDIDPARLANVTTYLNLAARTTLSVKPVLIVMTGLSGTGKSTVARAISRALGAPSIASDVIRKELAGVEGPTPAAQQAYVYSEEMTERTYTEMLRRAAGTLQRDQVAIADATFLESERRAQAAAVAAAMDVPLLIVETVCDDAAVAARLRARQTRGTDPSDAGIAIYQRQRARQVAHPTPIPSGATLVQIDTTTARPDAVDPVFTALNELGVLDVRIPNVDAPFA